VAGTLPTEDTPPTEDAALPIKPIVRAHALLAVLTQRPSTIHSRR